MKAVAATVLVGLLLAGCGSGGARTPDPGRLPLVAGSRVAERVRACDSGTSAYCAVEMVIVDPQMRTSWQLIAAEQRLLYRRRWTPEDAINGNEHAAQSPGDKWRVTYATAYGDLQGIDLGWIQRSHRITTALSDALFNRSPAISMMLEVGS
jgi:hypothetical protein